MGTRNSKVVEIDWKPDRREKLSLPSQIVQYFIDKISKGDWLIGDQIPSHRALASLFDVNRSTISSAIAELTSLNILTTNFGSGTTITNDTWSLLVSSAPPNWRGYINSSIHNPNTPTIQTINQLEFEKSVTRLGTGELSPSLIPHDFMEKAFHYASQRSLNYIGPMGLPQLRQALSDYLVKFGIRVPASRILIVSGSLQALHLISIGLLKPNSTIYTERTSYVKSLNLFQSAKMNLVGMQMDKDGILPTTIDQSQGTSLLYTIPTFHNPTGIVMSEKRRIELLEWCSINRVPILEDDAYRELWFDEEPPLPLKSFEENGNVLYMGTISKSLAPGFRLGWLVGPRAVVEHLGDIKMQIDYGANSISQWALTELIERGMYEKHLQRLRRQLIARKDIALNALNHYFKDIATWDIPKGSFYIWLRLRSKINMNKLFNLAIKQSLLINPGSLYDYTDDQHIRLSYSYAEADELTEGLRQLAGLIKIFIEK